MQGKKKLLLFEKEFILQFWISIIYQLDSIGINNNRFEYNTKKKKNRNWFFTNIILSSFKVFPSFFSLFNYPIIPTLIHPLYVFPFFFYSKVWKKLDLLEEISSRSLVIVSTNFPTHLTRIVYHQTYIKRFTQGYFKSLIHPLLQIIKFK